MEIGDGTTRNAARLRQRDTAGNKFEPGSILGTRFRRRVPTGFNRQWRDEGTSATDVARDLSTLAPLRALRARTPNRAWARLAVGEGVRSCPRAGCGGSACPVRELAARIVSADRVGHPKSRFRTGLPRHHHAARLQRKSNDGLRWLDPRGDDLYLQGI
jgi:hypothetical protein